MQDLFKHHKKNHEKKYLSFEDCIPQWLEKSSSIYIVILNQQGFVEYSNHAFQKVGVFRPNQAEKFFFPSIVKYPKAFISVDLVDHSSPQSIGLKFGSEENSIRWFSWTTSVESITNKQYLVCTGFEIRCSVECRNDQFSSNLADLIWENSIFSVADSKGRIVMANDKFCDYTKFSRVELIGKRHSEIVYDHHPKEFWLSMMKKVQQGESWNNEIKVQSKVGETYWFQTMISPIMDKKGNIIQLFHIQFDITEYKRTQEEKSELFNRYSKIAANLPGFIYQLFVPDNGLPFFPFLSEGIEKFGLETFETQKNANHFFQRIHEDDLPKVKDGLVRSAQTFCHWNQSFRYKKAGSGYIWVQNIATPEVIKGKGIIWHGFCYDISLRKISEEKLKKNEKRLSEIAFIQSHEFRKPIANMLGIFDIIQTEKDLNQELSPQMKEWLELLHNSILETDAIIAKIVSRTDET